MKKLILSLSLASSLSLAYAQQSVSIGTTDTKTNAVLYLKGDGNQGLIIPVTTNHNNVPVTEGMIVYDKSDGKIYKCDGTTWTSVEGSGSGSDSQNLTITGNNLVISGGNSVPIAGGAPTQAGQLLMWDGSKWISSSTNVPTTTGQVLKWNSTTKTWEAGTDNGTAYTAGTGINITAGTITNTGDTDATNDITTSSTAAGELTGTFPNLTINSGAITSTKIAAGAVGLTQLANGPFNNVLTTDGTGKPTWAPGGSGVTSVTASAPLSTAGTAIAPVINFPTWPGVNAPGALTNNGTGTLSWQVPTMSGPAGGDLSGTYPNPTITNGAISGGTGGKITDGSITGVDLAANISVSTTGNIAVSSPGIISGNGSGITTIDATNISSGTLPITRGGTGSVAIPTNGQVLIGNGTGYTLSTLTAGSGVTVTNGAGTISIAATGLTNPMTTIGDIIIGNASGTPARLGGSAGFLKSTGPALPAWSALAATDIPNLDASKITTGTLPTARGGTGIASVTNGGVAYGAAGNFAFSPVGTTGQVLTSNGAAAPTWTNAGLSPTLPSANIFIGNISNIATAVTVSGDATISNAGAITLANSASARTNLGLGSFATLTNPLTTTGDLIYGTSTTPTRLGIGTLGQVLTVGAGGLPLWQTAPGFINPMTSASDMIIGGASGAATRLPAPAVNQVLSSDGTGAITWVPHVATIPRAANLVFASPNGSAGIPSFRTLVDADIAGTAAIAGTKVNPAFAAQNISTTGTVTAGATTVTNLTVSGSTTLNTKTYTWPNAVAGAGTFLKNDGSGNLSWSAPGGFTTANVIPKGNGSTLVASQIFDDGTNVGIGTTGPTQLLDVVGGSINTSKDYMIGGTAVLKDGGSNVIVGDLTPAVTLGSRNSIFGSQAAQIMTGSATDNTISGFQAGSGITTGTSNTFIGSKVGQNTSTGSFNTFIGSTTGLNHTTGSYNVLIGVGADITGAGTFTNSVAIGHNAFAGGNGVMALGGTAADAVNVGINTGTPTERLDVGGNVRFSGALMPNNISGAAGQVLTSAGAGLPPTWTNGSSGWGLTGNAGTVSTTNFIGTTDNVALKFKTNNTIAGSIDQLNSNAFFGYRAAEITTGQQNVAVGTNALILNTTGNANTAMGTAAMDKTTGSNNVGIGPSALTTNTTGSNNTAIGSGADVSSGALTKATAIGFNAKVAQSNSLALGGTGVDAVNVGINTTSPTERLDVVGNLKFSGALLPNNLPGTAGQVLTSAGAGLSPTWTTGGSGWGLTGNGGTSPTTNFIGTSDSKDFVFRTNNIEAVRISTTGNLGIGTITPGSKLDVVGTSSFVDNTTTATGYSTIVQNNISGSGISGGALQVTNSGARTIDNDAMSIQNLATKSGGSGSTKTGLTIQSTGSWAPTTGQVNRGLFVNASGADFNYSAIFSGGNVGISTTSPTERLDVVGNLKFSGTLMPNNLPGTPGQVLTSTGGTTAPTWTTISGGGWGLNGNAGTTPATNFIGTTDAQDLVFKANSAESFRVNSTTGNIGIGTNTPAQKLDVIGYIRIGAGTGTSNDGLTLASPAPGFSSIIAGGRATNQFQISQTNNAPMTFLTNGAERMRIDGGGNVGIGTASPGQSLDVGAGNINVGTGNYILGGVTILKNNGTANIFIGASAGAATAGFNNTFTGASAGGTGATGNFNTFTGANAGGPNTGNNNTFTGADAGGANTSGVSNTFVGRTAGNSNTTGSSNVIIGANANVSTSNLTNATAIGANTTVGASNSLVLGNAANVGIGTTTPTSKLQVSGGDVDVTTGGVTSSGTTGAGVNMLPIAYFCVIGSATPSLGAAKTSNVTAVTFVGTGDYKYTITGEDFSTITNYVVVATLIGAGGGQIRVTNNGTNLEILTYNATGASLTNQSYSVVVYKP